MRYEPHFSGVSETIETRTLTKREHEIASLVAQGLANKVVAGQLGVCEGTVKLHLHSIYRKLRVASRAGSYSDLHVKYRKEVLTGATRQRT